MYVDLKDIFVRAFKTFVQAFLAVVLAGLMTVDSVEAVKALAVAGLAGGISALQNFVKETL